MAGLLGDFDTASSSDDERTEDRVNNNTFTSFTSSTTTTTTRFSTHGGPDLVSEFDDAFGERGGTIRFASRSPSPPPADFTRTVTTHTTPTTTRRYISSTHEINELSRSPASPVSATPTNVAYRTEEGWHAGNDGGATSQYVFDQTENDNSFVTRTVSSTSGSHVAFHTGQTQSTSLQTGGGTEVTQSAPSNSRRISGLSTLSSRITNEREQSDSSSFQQATGGRSRPISGGWTRRPSGFEGSVDNESRYDDAEETGAFQSRSTSRTGSFYTLSDAADGQSDFQPYSITNELIEHEIPSTPSRLEREVHTSRMESRDLGGDDESTLMTPRRNLFGLQSQSGVQGEQNVTRTQDSRGTSSSQFQNESSFTSSNTGLTGGSFGQQSAFGNTTSSTSSGQAQSVDYSAAQNGERNLSGQDLGTRTGTVKRVSNTADNATIGQTVGTLPSQSGSVSTSKDLSGSSGSSASQAAVYSSSANATNVGTTQRLSSSTTDTTNRGTVSASQATEDRDTTGSSILSQRDAQDRQSQSTLSKAGAGLLAGAGAAGVAEAISRNSESAAQGRSGFSTRNTQSQASSTGVDGSRDVKTQIDSGSGVPRSTTTTTTTTIPSQGPVTGQKSVVGVQTRTPTQRSQLTDAPSTKPVGQGVNTTSQTQASAQSYTVQPRQTEGAVVIAQPTTKGQTAGSSQTQAQAQQYQVQPRTTEGSVVVAQPTTTGTAPGLGQTQAKAQNYSLQATQPQSTVTTVQSTAGGQTTGSLPTQVTAQTSTAPFGQSNRSEAAPQQAATGQAASAVPQVQSQSQSQSQTQAQTRDLPSSNAALATAAGSVTGLGAASQTKVDPTSSLDEKKSVTAKADSNALHATTQTSAGIPSNGESLAIGALTADSVESKGKQSARPGGSDGLSRSDTARRISRDLVGTEAENVSKTSATSVEKGKGTTAVSGGSSSDRNAAETVRDSKSEAGEENVPLATGSVVAGGMIGAAVLDYAKTHYNATPDAVNGSTATTGSSTAARQSSAQGKQTASNVTANRQVSDGNLSAGKSTQGTRGTAQTTASAGAAGLGTAAIASSSKQPQQATSSNTLARTPSQRATAPVTYDYFISRRPSTRSSQTTSQPVTQEKPTANLGSTAGGENFGGSKGSSSIVENKGQSLGTFGTRDSKQFDVEKRAEKDEPSRTDSAALAGGLAAGGLAAGAAAAATQASGGSSLPFIDTASKSTAPGSQTPSNIVAQRALERSESYLTGGKEAAESPILLEEGGVDEKLIHPFGAFEKDIGKDKSAPTAIRQSSWKEDYGEGEEMARAGSVISRYTTNADPEEQAEINRLMSRMFGATRQEHSEEEKTRHVGIVFKHLTVKGVGLGASLQPTTGDIFLGFPRFIKNVFTRGPSKAAGRPPIKTILRDFSGVIKPGEMCLVLGKPGSGCSTFLKIIGNQRFGYESIEGDVTYGGTDARTMYKKYRSEVLYNPEEDLHYATLSVKSTLEFALKTKTPGKESRNEGETAKDYVSNFLRAIVKLFWIEHTMQTKVGNEYIRGVSGGEKKRVSIAEAMITKASIQCWDNSTRGLDASTALEYVSSIRSLTDMAHISTAVALYQAGENLYRRFDKVLLIEGGRCCFFGDANVAAKYFESLGFVRPERWTTADFLTSVTDEHERHIREGWENRIPRTADEFGDAFMKSEQYQTNLREIEGFEQETQKLVDERHRLQGKATKRKNYTISFWWQVIYCTHRQFLVMFGDRETLIGKWGGILFQALIVGSLFYNLSDTSLGVFPRGGTLFFMLLFNALLALSELTGAFQSRPILLKHKSFQFYRPAAFAIAQTVVDIPLVLIQVFIFDIVVYFMAHLSRTAGQFFINYLFLFIITMSMYAFFRAIGALVGSLDAATRVTGVFIQAIIVYTGYLIPPTKMHPWFSWIRWINPVQYGFEALMANEFHSLNITCVTPMLVPQGPGTSAQYQGCTIQGSQPGQTYVLGSDYIETAYRYRYSHVWRNFGIIIGFFIFFVVVTAVGMELQKPNKNGGAVTIYKRGQVPRAFEKAMESGQEPLDVEKGDGSGTDAKAGWAEKEKLQADSNGSNGSDSDEAVKGVAKHETVFTWQNVNYTIPVHKGERRLLQDVQGYVRPGKLTALMGASGAGKTTLLNTLAQRITFGRIEGNFLVDGRSLPKSFQRSSGFAEQMDVHEPTATVREALRFSALLRQPREVPTEEKYAYCETVLRLLEMENIAGATIGKPGNGLNQEQRKRLTIGVELASKPELLMFLDEPTSGLDSQSAFNIVRLLRKLASAGQAILCTIHQPSAVLFEEFDELLLLKSGGRIVYHGELGRDSRHLIEYFESNGGKKCSPKANPAEYMLEVIGAGDPDYDGPDWGDIWADSGEKQHRTREIEEMISRRRDATADGALRDEREYAMGWWIQIYAVVYRNFVAYWRSPEYLIGKFILHIVTGLFNTFTFWHLGSSSIDMQSRLFSVFMTLTISPPLIQQLQPRFIDLRSIYQSRERNSKIYGWYAFVWAAILPELPYSFVAGTIYWCCWYWATWFPRGTLPAVTVWLFVCLFEMFYISFGQAIASFAPNELLASILVPIFFTFIVSFCGVVVPAASLPYFWRAWMYDLTPFRYLIEGILAPIIHNVRVVCADNELAKFAAPPGQTCDSYAGAYANASHGYVETLSNGLCGFCQYRTGDDFGTSFNVYYSHVWRDYGLVYAYVVFNFAVVFLASYLYLGGGRKLIRWIRSRSSRK